MRVTSMPREGLPYPPLRADVTFSVVKQCSLRSGAGENNVMVFSHTEYV